MKKKNMLLWIIFFALIAFPNRVFSWGSATHAFIDDHLGKKTGMKNLNEIYGGTGPDFFNFSFDNPYLSYLSFQTHDEFMKVWDNAGTRIEKAPAYGFVSHNDVWGADSTAHHQGITFGQNEGYIIAKAAVLKTILEQIPQFNDLNLPDSVAREICHNLVECGVDILITKQDPLLGKKIISSALLRSPEFSSLLVKAYADGLSHYAGMSYPEAVETITSTEKEFRKSLVLYGQALSQDTATALQLLAEQMAELAKNFFASYGITLPEGVDLVPLIKFGIGKSMQICANDFSPEITATISFVGQQLFSHGVMYW